MLDNRVNVSEILDVLSEWFETIEEVVMDEAQRYALWDVAESLAASKSAAFEMGIQEEDFDDWLRMDVLEHWSIIAESLDEGQDPLESFYQFMKMGEQDLYLQMLKRCVPIARSA